MDTPLFLLVAAVVASRQVLAFVPQATETNRTQLAAQLYVLLFPFAFWQHPFGATLVNTQTDSF